MLPFPTAPSAAGLIIDARSKGNLARLLNSSCDPNCVSQKWHDASNSEVG
jgi:SET domain-containing protein